MVDPFNESKTALSESNSAFYNASSFALRVKKEDVFTDELLSVYRTGSAALSALDNRIMWLPSYALPPSFFYANKIYFKTFLGGHRDVELPVVLCVAKQSLEPELAAIYEDDQVCNIMNGLMRSLVAHTTEPFSNDVPKQAPSIAGYLEDKLRDDEVLLVYTTLIHIIHKLGNSDEVLVYSEETVCNDVTIGSGIKALSIFTESKIGSEKYIPQPLPCHPDPTVMGTGQIIMREARHLVRLLLKLGKGDAGSSKDEETDAQDTTFEETLLSMIAKNPPPSGPGALSMVASYFALHGITNTISKTNRKYDLDIEQTGAWSMLSVFNLTAFSALTVAHVTAGDKEILFHTKTANPLTNLQFTAARECRTYAQLILYLAYRTCLARYSQNTLSSIKQKSSFCESCNSGENCAMTWVCALNESKDLSDNLTDAKKKCMSGPISSTYTQVFVSEFNDQASVLGGLGTETQRAGKGYLEAYRKTMSYLEPFSLTIPKDATSPQALTAMMALFIKAQKYIAGAEHKVPLLHRNACMGNKLETVLTDNDGGVQKMSLGLMSIPLLRSKVLTYFLRFAYQINCKLADFIQKPAQGLSDAHSAIASKNVGVYSQKKDQDQIPMKTYYLHPLTDLETQEVYNINTAPKVSPKSVDQISVKTTNKYKMLNGTLRAAFESSVGGGMAFGATVDTLTQQQRAHLRSSISWSLVKLCPGFNAKIVTKHIDDFIDLLLATPLSVYDEHDLMVGDANKLLSLFVFGSLMVANGFQIKTNNWYSGVSVPKFARLKSADFVSLDPVSQTFLCSGPTLVYAKTKVGTFSAKVKGRPVTFVSCTMNRFNPLKQFVGTNMLALSNCTMAGVFIPIKSDYTGGAAEVDEICQEIRQLAELSKAERCASFLKNAKAFVAEIRATNPRLKNDEPIGYDQVYTLFAQYDADVLLNDENLNLMAKHVMDEKFMATICERVKNVENYGKKEGGEETEVDFNAMLQRAGINVAGSCSSMPAAAAVADERTLPDALAQFAED